MIDTGSSTATFASADARISRILAAGFGATTLMWLFSYLAILVPGAVIGEFFFGLAVLALLVGGVVAGRADGGLGESAAASKGVGSRCACGLGLGDPQPSDCCKSPQE